jgi:beta-1,4-mannosyltransferase
MSAGLGSSLMRAIRESPSGAPRVLVFAPIARMNPFQELLYRELETVDVSSVPLLDWGQRAEITTAVHAGANVAFHLHWTTVVAAEATSAVEAAAMHDQFVNELDEWRSSGIRFVWTVHNRLPHDCPYPAEEVAFRQKLADRADVVHVMHESATAEVAADYRLPADRVAVIEHPPYDAVYPTYVTQRDTRRRLGIGDNDVVIAAIGAIRPYQGLDRLAEAVRLARRKSGRTIWLIVGGDPPSKDDLELNATLASLDRDPHSIVEARRLSDREVSEFAIASDVFAAVYSSPLTSGAATLGLTVGRAVVAADTGANRSQIGPAGRFVAGNSVDELASCLVDLDRDTARRVGSLAREQLASDPALEFAQRIGEMFDAAR